jgi:glycosyltransferase involved in cell wall biosynthesis
VRIAFVYDAIYPYVAGGAERRYYEIGHRLAARGHHVRLMGWQWWQGRATRMREGMRLQGVGKAPALHDAAGRRTFREAAAFAARLAAPLAAVDADIVECSSIPYAPTFVAAALGRARGVPVAVCWHEYMDEGWGSYAGRRGRVAARVERLSAQCGTARIAVSEFTKRRLPPGPPLTVLENGVDYDAIASLSNAARTIDVVVASRLVPHKRVDLLLQALALLPGAKAQIIGEGPERQRLEREANRLGVEDRVTFVGRLASAGEVYAALGSARATVVTSEQEGFGMSVIEAQAAGTPPVVVRSALSAAADLVVDGETGLLADPEPEAIAAALGRLMQEPKLRNRLAVSAQTAARLFDWDAITDRAEAIYASLLHAPVGTSQASTRSVAA